LASPFAGARCPSVEDPVEDFRIAVDAVPPLSCPLRWSRLFSFPGQPSLTDPFLVLCTLDFRAGFPTDRSGCSPYHELFPRSPLFFLSQICYRNFRRLDAAHTKMSYIHNSFHFLSTLSLSIELVSENPLFMRSPCTDLERETVQRLFSPFSPFLKSSLHRHFVRRLVRYFFLVSAFPFRSRITSVTVFAVSLP